MIRGLNSANSRFFSCGFLILSLLISGCSKENGTAPSESLSDRIAAARAIEDPRDRAEALITIGLECVATQDKLGAKNCLREATRSVDQIDIETNAADRALTYASLAAAWHTAADREASKKARRKSESAADQVDQPLEKTEVLIQLAQLKITLEELDQAIDHLKAAEEQSGKIADSNERTLNLTRIAHGFAQAKDANASGRVIEVAVALAESQEAVSDQCRLLALIGSEQIKSLGDKDGGAATLKKALDTARSITDNKNQQANRLIDVAEYYIELGQTGSASTILTEAETLVEGLSEGKPARDRIERLRGEL